MAQNQEAWAQHCQTPSAVLFGCVVACTQHQPNSCTQFHRQQSPACTSTKVSVKASVKAHLRDTIQIQSAASLEQDSHLSKHERPIVPSKLLAAH